MEMPCSSDFHNDRNVPWLSDTYLLSKAINKWAEVILWFCCITWKWFLYGAHLYKGLCALIQVKEKPERTVTGSVRIPSLIFTLVFFSFFCPLDLETKSEIQKLAKSLFPSYCAQDLVFSSNLPASWFTPGHWWLSDSLRHWMDFVGVMLGLYTVTICS